MNDSSAELVAAVERGPFAVPDTDEQLQYLLSRIRKFRSITEKHSVLHVLSYQRRVSFIKEVFFARGRATPLGELIDWWDRGTLSSAHKHPLGRPGACMWTLRALCSAHTIPRWCGNPAKARKRSSAAPCTVTSSYG